MASLKRTIINTSLVSPDYGYDEKTDSYYWLYKISNGSVKKGITIPCSVIKKTAKMGEVKRYLDMLIMLSSEIWEHPSKEK